MAASGSISGRYNENHQWEVTLAAVLQSSNCVPFGGNGLPYSTFVLSGTLGAATLQWQVSNDGGTTWTNLNPVMTSLPVAGTLTAGNMSFEKYQLLVNGGDGTTSVAGVIAFSSSY